MTKEKLKLLLLASAYDFKNNDLFIKSLDDNEATFKFVHYSEPTSENVPYKTISIEKLEESAKDLMFALENDKEFSKDYKEESEECIKAWEDYNKLIKK